MTLLEPERTMGARSVLELGKRSGHAMNPMHGKPFDGRRPRKHCAGRANRFSLTLLHTFWAKPNLIEIRCSTEWIIGAQSWMGRAGSTFMGTTVWPWEILTEMAWMICMSASPRDFRTGSIAIAGM